MRDFHLSSSHGISSSSTNVSSASQLSSMEIQSLSGWYFDFNAQNYVARESGLESTLDAFQASLPAPDRKGANFGSVLSMEMTNFFSRRSNWANIALAGLFIALLAMLEPVAIAPKEPERRPEIPSFEAAFPEPTPHVVHKKQPRKTETTPVPAPAVVKARPKLDRLKSLQSQDSNMAINLDISRPDDSNPADVHFALNRNPGESTGDSFIFVPTPSGNKRGHSDDIGPGKDVLAPIRPGDVPTKVSGSWVKVKLVGSIAQWQIRCLNNPGVHIFGDTKIQCRDNLIVAAWKKQ